MNIIEKHTRWYFRINSELYYLLIINFVIILVDFQLLIHYWGLIEFFILILIIISLLRKSSRIVYKINFEDSNEKLIIYYYQFIIMKFSKTISYRLLNYKYNPKSYGLGNVMHSLVFLNSNRFIAEIREKNRIGWTKNDIVKIIEKIKNINNERIS